MCTQNQTLQPFVVILTLTCEIRRPTQLRGRIPPRLPLCQRPGGLRWVEDVGVGAEGRTEVFGVNFWPKPRTIQNNRLETRWTQLPIQRNRREAADHSLQHHGESRPANPATDYRLKPNHFAEGSVFTNQLRIKCSPLFFPSVYSPRDVRDHVD